MLPLIIPAQHGPWLPSPSRDGERVFLALAPRRDGVAVGGRGRRPGQRGANDLGVGHGLSDVERQKVETELKKIALKKEMCVN